MKKLLVLSVFILLVAGCIEGQDPNFITVDPNFTAMGDIIAEGAEQIGEGLTFLSIFVPSLAAVGGILAGLGGLWKKVEPKLQEARTETQLYYNVTTELIKAIEEYKKNNPEAWIVLKGKLIDKFGENKEILAVIEAIRNS